MPRKKVPVIRESSKNGLTMICVSEEDSACPKNTIVIERFQEAYIVKVKDENSLTFKNLKCEPLPNTLSIAYHLALQTSREIAGEEEFTISFEGKSKRRETIKSGEFYNFVQGYFKEEYGLKL